MKFGFYFILLLIFGVITNPDVYSQELEPRALTNLPIGTHFIIGGYGFASGNILMDQSLPLDDLDAKLHTFVGAYVRSFNFFGMSAKVDAIVPFATGDWYYTYQGDDEYTQSNGFGDARLRISINFSGAPALKKEAYKDYVQKTIVGYSFQIVMPTGNYNNDQLVNLGSNRWAFKNQLGLSKTLNKWTLEGNLALWLFTKNPDFLNGNVRKQNPLATLKVHVIRSLQKRLWVSLGIGYGYGGKTYLNDIQRDVVISTMRLGLFFALPIKTNHTIRLSGFSGVRFQQGPDFDAISLSYQFRWNRKQ